MIKGVGGGGWWGPFEVYACKNTKTIIYCICPKTIRGLPNISLIYEIDLSQNKNKKINNICTEFQIEQNFIY